jgi:hypothetical protein
MKSLKMQVCCSGRWLVSQVVGKDYGVYASKAHSEATGECRRRLVTTSETKCMCSSSSVAALRQHLLQQQPIRHLQPRLYLRQPKRRRQRHQSRSAFNASWCDKSELRKNRSVEWQTCFSLDIGVLFQETEYLKRPRRDSNPQPTDSK